MTIVDLEKARAYADSIRHPMHPAQDIAADWITELTDEVESLGRALRTARASEQAALADAARLLEERDAAIAGLTELYEQVVVLMAALGGRS